MHFSILIPTHNRADSLARTLESISHMNLPQGQNFEVVVVDNNSSDHTREVVERMAKATGLLMKWVLETRQGTNHARNRGIQEAKGTYLLFTDDDVVVTPHWLADYIKAFETYPNAACMSGRVIPEFSSGQPAWLPEDLLSYYGNQDYGDEARPFPFPKYPMEMNMAFRKDFLIRVGGFPTAIMRNATTLMSNDGKLFFNSLHHMQESVMYIPSGLIYHQIPPERITQDWLMKRIYWQGISDVVSRQLIDPMPKLAMLSRAMHIMTNALILLSGGQRSPRRIWWHYKKLTFSQRADLAYYKGTLAGILRELPQTHRPPSLQSTAKVY